MVRNIGQLCSALRESIARTLWKPLDLPRLPFESLPKNQIILQNYWTRTPLTFHAYLTLSRITKVKITVRHLLAHGSQPLIQKSSLP